MKTLKRIFLILAPLLLSLAAFSLALNFFDPQIQAFILNQIQKQSSLHLPIEIQAEKFSYSFFPPTVGIENVQIAPKTEIGVDLIEIKKIQTQLDVLQLLGGRLLISDVVLENPELQVDLDLVPHDKNNTNDIDLSPLFRITKILPLSKARIIDLDLAIQSKNLNLNLEVINSNLTLNNQGDQILLDSDIYVSDFNYQKWSDDLLLKSTIILSAKNLEIRNLKAYGFGLDAELSANVSDLAKLLKEPKASGSIRIQSDLVHLKDKLKKNVELPELTGNINTVIDFRTKGFDWPNANLEFHSSGLTANGFDIGSIDFNGEFRNKKFRAETLQLTNESATVNLNQIEVDIEKQEKYTFKIKTKVATEMLDLNELLKRLKVGDIPLELMTAGHFDCLGNLYPHFEIGCSGQAEGEALEVRTNNNTNRNILSIDQFQAVGDVKIDLEKVWYKANATLGQSKGQSEGTIRYDTGFDIHYNSDETYLRDIGPLGNLSLEGKVKLEGRTWGDSNQGQFIINVESQDLWLESYLLGHAKGQVRYAKSKLYFDNIQSTVGTSHYQGQVIADLAKEKLEVEGAGKLIEMTDIEKVFHRKIQLPFEYSGLADIEVKGNGPYDFSKFSYDFKTTIKQGTIANEHFDLLQTQIESIDGQVQTRFFEVKKGKGHISGSGQAQSSGQISLKLEGKNLLLEESENVSQLGTPVSGHLQATLQLNGHILNPDAILGFDLSNLIIDEQELQPSYATIRFNRNQISGNTNIFGGQLSSEFIYPFDQKNNFKLQVSARGWNYTSLFALLGGGFLLSDYNASLTGDLDIRSDHDSIWKSSGYGTIDKLSIQRGAVELTNSGPMNMTLNKGSLTLKDFRISNDDSYLELSSQNSTADKLSLRSRGKLSLSILQLLLPFTEELNGLSTYQLQVGGSLEKPEIFGNARVHEGFVKLKGFPHPFEKIESQIQFSQRRILISQLDSTLAGGTLKGEGLVQLEGYKNFPVNIHGKLDGASFFVPDGFRTNGFAEINMTGNWFPLTLSGTYHIQSGYIDKEFTNELINNSFKQSSYLPKRLLQNTFDPIELNIQTLIEKPISIRNSLFEGQVSGGLLIKGTPTQPSLTGKINIEKNSRLIFNSKPFEVSNGTLAFQNPKEVNPEIYITGRSRINDYDISLLVQGTAKDPLPRMTSQPPLPENDIHSLLAFGVVSSSIDKNSTLSQQHDTSENMKNMALTTLGPQISKVLEKNTPFQFQATSQYDDTKNISIQRYTVGAQVTNKFSISATQQKADIESKEFKLKYNFNPNWSSSASLEVRENGQTSSTNESQRQGQVLGLDLEFKQEFK